jgi:Sulfotransferase domain
MSGSSTTSSPPLPRQRKEATPQTIASRSATNLLRNILFGSSSSSSKTTEEEKPHDKTTTKKEEGQQHERAPEPPDPPPTSSSSLLIVGAGLGRTSTSSLTAALQQLSPTSYRTYQMTDGVQGVPGHVDVWHAHMEARHKVRRREGRSSTNFYSYDDDGDVRAAEAALMEAVVRDAAVYGFVATASMPPCFLFEAMMREFPHAVVMLTLRSEVVDDAAKAWARSMQHTVLNVPIVFERVPFRWIGRTHKVGQMIQYMMEELGAPYARDPATDRIAAPPSTEDLVGAYINWNDHVRSVVPPDRLLVHRPRTGGRRSASRRRPSVKRVSAPTSRPKRRILT